LNGKPKAQKLPGFAFLLPWSFDLQGGGVAHAVFALVDQCRSDDMFRPVAIELDWDASRPAEDEWEGIPRVRLRLRSPWSESGCFRTAVSYLLHLLIDIYRLNDLIKRYDIRVINRQFPGLEMFNFVLMRRLGLFRGKNMFTFQGTDVRLVLGTRGVARKLWKWMLRRTDLLIFVSQGLKEEFLAFDPQLEKRCTVVHNGVDVEAFKRRSEHFPSAELYEVSRDVILSIGKFEYRKGHDLLVRAFEVVLRQQRNARLVMIGGAGPTLEATRLLVSSLGLNEHVTILTNIPYDNIPGLISRSQVFVLCSRWEKGKFGEGFPLALVESGALARPVVTTNSTGCDEIIQDGQTGRLVEVEDPNALACAILDLLNNPKKAQRMGKNLHSLVCRQFTWQHAWGKYRAFIEA